MRTKEQTKQKTLKIVTAALFAALTCAATLIIRIPSPANGYVNMGDTIVLLGAWILGAVYGMMAGGIGSMLADLLSGYAYYAPGTLVIKAAMGLAAGLVVWGFGKFTKGRKTFPALLAAAFCAEAIMVLGYFLYAWAILGEGISAALQSIPGNLVQAVFGIVAAMTLYGAIEKKGLLKRLGF